MSLDHVQMISITKETQDMLNKSSAKFYKSDLHVHTLVSHDVHSPLSVEEYARQLMKQAQENGIELLAITDHNTIKDFNVFKSAAEDLGISLLAGAEISVPKSHPDPKRAAYIHVLAIHEKPDRIESILRTVNIEADSDPRTAIAKPDPLGLIPIIEIVLNKEAIPILAHSSSGRGFGNEFRDSYRIVISEQLKVLPFFVEITQEDDAKYFDGTDEDLQHIFAPCLFNSDCHTIDQSSKDERKLGIRCSFLKMQQPSFQNLKKVLREPKLRVLRSDPPPPPSPRVLSVVITGGYFEDLRAPFHPNLNVIIGSRGTGKSTLVSMIQFAFNVVPLTESGKDEHSGKIEDLLAEGNSVIISFVGNDDKIYLLKRTFLISKKKPVKAKLWQVQDDKTLIPQEIDSLSDIIEIEIYRQGELVEISKEVKNQLKLIDGYIEDRKLFLQREEIRTNIFKISEEIEIVLEKKEEIGFKIKEEKAIEERIQELTELIKFDFVKNHQKWINEYEFINKSRRYLTDLNKAICNFNYPLHPMFEGNEKVNSELIEQLQNSNEKIEEWLKSKLSETSDEFSFHSIHLEALALIHIWEGLYKNAEDEFRSQISGHKIDIEAILEMLEEKKREYAEIQNKYIPQSQELKNKIKKCQKSIDDKLGELLEKDQNIEKERKVIAEYFSENLPGIKVEFQNFRNIIESLDILDKRFTGGSFRLRNRKERFSNLLLAVKSPIELIYHFEDKNKREKLIEIIEDQKLIDLVDEYRYDAGFLRGVTYESPFMPVIKFEKTPEHYISLEDLSLGEKCGTILSIILLQKGKPKILVIDTPESEMDHNHFISQVVNTMAIAKNQRQLIFVTHNPNIPVLADAELILEIESTGVESGKIHNLGYLDDEGILDAVLSLEGGEEAFKRRSRRYGFSLTVSSH